MGSPRSLESPRQMMRTSGLVVICIALCFIPAAFLAGRSSLVGDSIFRRALLLPNSAGSLLLAGIDGAKHTVDEDVNRDVDVAAAAADDRSSVVIGGGGASATPAAAPPPTECEMPDDVRKSVFAKSCTLLEDVCVDQVCCRRMGVPRRRTLACSLGLCCGRAWIVRPLTYPHSLHLSPRLTPHHHCSPAHTPPLVGGRAPPSCTRRGTAR